LARREDVHAFWSGLGEALWVVAVGVDAGAFQAMAGLDALYFSLTRAERWGARPISPYSAGLLQTTEADQQQGMPRYVLTGLVLNDGDPNTAAFCIPRITAAVRQAVDKVNASRPGAIRSIGFFEFELSFPGTSLNEVGRLFGQSWSR